MYTITLAMAALASLDTLQLLGKQSLMILVTIDVGRFKSSGFSAILGGGLFQDLYSSESQNYRWLDILVFLNM